MNKLMITIRGGIRNLEKAIWRIGWVARDLKGTMGMIKGYCTAFSKECSTGQLK